MFFFSNGPSNASLWSSRTISISKTKLRIKNLSCVAQPFLGYPPDKVRQENSFLFDIKKKKFKTPKRKLFSHANSVKDYVGVLS